MRVGEWRVSPGCLRANLVQGDEGEAVEVPHPARGAGVLGGDEFEAAFGGEGLAVEAKRDEDVAPVKGGDDLGAGVEDEVEVCALRAKVAMEEALLVAGGESKSVACKQVAESDTRVLLVAYAVPVVNGHGSLWHGGEVCRGELEGAAIEGKGQHVRDRRRGMALMHRLRVGLRHCLGGVKTRGRREGEQSQAHA